MRVAALDLGTNTFLCLIAEVSAGRIERVVDDQTRLVRLGQGVNQTRQFHPDALARAAEALHEYAELIRQHRAQKVMAVATSAARDVKNGHELFKICEAHHIPVQIISGDLEAELTFKGATCEMQDSGGIAVIDVGGGSTEIIHKPANAQKLLFKSVDVGSVRMTELFIEKQPAPESALQRMQDYIAEKMRAFHFPTAQIRQVVGVAGTPTTLAEMEQGIGFLPEKIDQYRLSLEQLEHWIGVLNSMGAREIVEKYKIEEKRADVMLAGTIVLKCALAHLQQRELVVSIRGVRYGLALQLGER